MDNNLIISPDRKVLEGVRDKSITSVIVPDGVTEIGGQVFRGCTSLTSIAIPNSVTKIGYAAFEGCTSLTSIDIPNSVTEIDEYAFRGTEWLIKQPKGLVIINNILYSCNDKKIVNIVIPNSVTKIERDAFSCCFKIKEIHCRTKEEIEKMDISETAFNKHFYNNCVLYVPSGTRWSYRHHPVWGKFKNIEIEK